MSNVVKASEDVRTTPNGRVRKTQHTPPNQRHPSQACRRETDRGDVTRHAHRVHCKLVLHPVRLAVRAFDHIVLEFAPTDAPKTGRVRLPGHDVAALSRTLSCGRDNSKERTSALCPNQAV